MTSRDFCYWLQGYFEIFKADFGDRTLGEPKLSDKQIATVQKHLSMVFKHEIDPSHGNEAIQNELNTIHSPRPDGALIRC